MKNALITYWRLLNDRYKTLKPRERQMLAACILVTPAYLLNSAVYEPAKAQQSRASAAATAANRNVNALSQDLAALQLQLQQSPDALLQAEKAKLLTLEHQADLALTSMSRVLVSPSEMNEVLKSVLGNTAGLRLRQLTTLPPESVLSQDATSPAANTFDLYKHGVEISIEGRYTDLQTYLLQLEAQDKQLLWDQLQFRVDQYPLSVLTLRVHTLSVDKTWLRL